MHFHPFLTKAVFFSLKSSQFLFFGHVCVGLPLFSLLICVGCLHGTDMTILLVCYGYFSCSSVCVFILESFGEEFPWSNVMAFPCMALVAGLKRKKLPLLTKLYIFCLAFPPNMFVVSCFVAWHRGEVGREREIGSHLSHHHRRVGPKHLSAGKDGGHPPSYLLSLGITIPPG